MRIYEESSSRNLGDIRLCFDESGAVAKDDSSLACTKELLEVSKPISYERRGGGGGSGAGGFFSRSSSAKHEF